MSISTSLHLQDTSKIATNVYTYDRQETPALGVVEIEGQLSLVGKTPAQLLLLADALTDTARRLSDELDKAAAREVNTAEAVPA